MRIPVLTGVLACTLIFIGASEQANAAPLEILENNVPKSEVIDLLVVAGETPEEVVEEIRDEAVKHEVKENESLHEIATIHRTTWKRIYDKNIDIEDPNLINPGEVFDIPKTDEELASREIPIPEPIVVEPIQRTAPTNYKSVTASSYTTPIGSSAGNRYTAGNCTWYAKSRRPDMPNNLGNASTWVSRAASQGFATGSVPRAGAIGQRSNHVVYVESVNADGTVNVSEMNYRALYSVTSRTVAANYFTYIY